MINDFLEYFGEFEILSMHFDANPIGNMSDGEIIADSVVEPVCDVHYK